MRAIEFLFSGDGKDGVFVFEEEWGEYFHGWHEDVLDGLASGGVEGFDLIHGCRFSLKLRNTLIGRVLSSIEGAEGRISRFDV